MLNSILIDSAGFANKSQVILSPNFDNRPNKSNISLIVIHNISLPPGIYGGDNIIDLFTNLKVSSHFLIRRNGSLIQFVSCLDRAWHAGESSWNKENNCNDFSIGIELEGSDNDAFESEQYRCLQELIQSIVYHYPIKGIAGHSDIAPSRKTDPGPYFEWDKIKSIFKELMYKH